MQDRIRNRPRFVKSSRPQTSSDFRSHARSFPQPDNLRSERIFKRQVGLWVQGLITSEEMKRNIEAGEELIVSVPHTHF